MGEGVVNEFVKCLRLSQAFTQSFFVLFFILDIVVITGNHFTTKTADLIVGPNEAIYGKPQNASSPHVVPT